MNFYKQVRSCLVGAQFIGIESMYRPMVRRCAFQADTSAVGTINRPLPNDRCWLLNFIIGEKLDTSASIGINLALVILSIAKHDPVGLSS